MFEMLRRKAKEDAKRKVLDELAEKELGKLDAEIAGDRAAQAKRITTALEEFLALKPALQETIAKKADKVERAIAALKKAQDEHTSAQGALLTAQGQYNAVRLAAEAKLRATADPEIDIFIAEMHDLYVEIQQHGVSTAKRYTGRFSPDTGKRVFEQSSDAELVGAKLLAITNARVRALELKAQHCEDVASALEKLRDGVRSATDVRRETARLHAS